MGRKRIVKAKWKVNMTFADAAERVLRDNGAAMKNSTIAKEAIKKGYLETTSSRPDTSMYVSLRSDNRSREKRGVRPRFIFRQGGQVSLSEWNTGNEYDRIVESASKSRDRASKCIVDNLIKHNNGADFEKFVGDLLVKLGYEKVEVIGGMDDQGVDITCEESQGIMTRKLAIQCKCKNKRKKIGPKDVSTLRDNLSTYQADAGLIITTTDLNEEAKAKAAEPGKERIHYINGDQLGELCAQHRVGVRKQTVEVFDVDAKSYDYLKNTAEDAATRRKTQKKKPKAKKSKVSRKAP